MFSLPVTNSAHQKRDLHFGMQHTEKGDWKRILTNIFVVCLSVNWSVLGNRYHEAV